MFGAGTVIVLTTPDANRTFLSYLGTSQELCVDTSVRSHVRRSRMLLIEGYVWEMPNAAASISQVGLVRLKLDPRSNHNGIQKSIRQKRKPKSRNTGRDTSGGMFD